MNSLTGFLHVLRIEKMRNLMYCKLYEKDNF